MRKISDKDKNDWKKFIESDEKLLNKDKSDNVNQSLQSYKIIDLHGYTLDEANKTIHNFIEKSFEEGVKELNIVTGKGSRSKNEDDPYKSRDLAILKYSIPNYIQNNLELMNKIQKIDMDSINSPLKGSFNIILKKNLNEKFKK